MGRNKSILGDVLIMAMLGIFQCGLVQWLNANGIWIDQYITASHTIEDLMLLIIIINVIVGLVIGSSRK